MYPELFRIGDFVVTSFGVFVALGAAVGLWIFHRELTRSRPSSLPWAVAFPRGFPPTVDRVHPTQLYEAAFLGVLAWLLIRWRRHGIGDSIVLGRYLLLAGSARFLIEFLRINPSVALGLTTAQWGTLVLMAVGGWLLARPVQTTTFAVERTK